MPNTGEVTADRFRQILASVAPGTPLRDGLERVLRGNTGALIILGHDKVIDSISTGGVPIDVEFTASLLRELAKMDGAIVLSTDGSRILRAATHLVPDPTIPTEEYGTRHRTAERVARQSGFPVISVSKSMQIIALYYGHTRHVLSDSTQILSRANQALATLERYRLRLDEVSGTLSALEIEDLVVVRDVVTVLIRLESVRRIADEIAEYVVELGVDGRLLSLQLDELMGGVGEDRELIVRDYMPTGRRTRSLADLMTELANLSAADIIDPLLVAKAAGLPATVEGQESSVSPRGYRLLSKIPRLPAPVVDRLVDHFGGLQKLLAAGIDDLQAVEGVGETRARSVREGLSRLAETLITDRYV